MLSDTTKLLMENRNNAQAKATETDDPNDWRAYRSFRNQVTAKSRADKTAWEREKLDHSANTSTDIWKTVKGWLGWGSAGTPTQLSVRAGCDKSSWVGYLHEQVLPRQDQEVETRHTSCNC